MNENLRVSDADRERVAERLREHFAEGRLTSDEFDERLNAALNAKTVRDLSGVMTDLPEPEPAPAPSRRPSHPAGWHGYRPAYRRGPRLLPLAIIALLIAVAIPSTAWFFLAFLKIVVIAWLVMCVLGIFAAARFRRHVRRHYREHMQHWQSIGSGWQSSRWQAGDWRSPGWRSADWQAQDSRSSD
jgi:Domain of unknown function (DUF1707)